MLSEEIIVKIIKAIRSNPFLKKYSDIISKTPSIDVSYINDENKLELRGIRFNDYDEIIVTEKAITHVEYHDHSNENKNVLLEYDGWDELCDILGVDRVVLKT